MGEKKKILAGGRVGALSSVALFPFSLLEAFSMLLTGCSSKPRSLLAVTFSNRIGRLSTSDPYKELLIDSFLHYENNMKQKQNKEIIAKYYTYLHEFQQGGSDILVLHFDVSKPPDCIKISNNQNIINIKCMH